MAASSGFVAPITWRAATTASWPSSTIATSGPLVMNVDELAEERALGVLGVVLLRELAADGHELQRGEPQALALEAGDDLAGQVPREGVGLDQDQGPVHGISVLGVGSQCCVDGGTSLSSASSYASWGPSPYPASIPSSVPAS